MRQQSSIKGALWIAVAAIIVGLIFIIAGAIVTGIAYTEITPPNYDENYDRYIGSSVPRLIGPFILVFGIFIVFTSAGIMAFKSLHSYDRLKSQEYSANQGMTRSNPPSLA